jgi:hypothetical protein
MRPPHPPHALTVFLVLFRSKFPTLGNFVNKAVFPQTPDRPAYGSFSFVSLLENK